MPASRVRAEDTEIRAKQSSDSRWKSLKMKDFRLTRCVSCRGAISDIHWFIWNSCSIANIDALCHESTASALRDRPNLVGVTARRETSWASLRRAKRPTHPLRHCPHGGGTSLETTANQGVSQVARNGGGGLAKDEGVPARTAPPRSRSEAVDDEATQRLVDPERR